jgi:dephospho-CoA kinase
VTAPHRTVRIGITGPIGCGKSTVAGWLAQEGAVVVDADEVARSVSDPAGPAFDAIVEAFGTGILTGDGIVDRAALGKIVFTEPDRLRELEAIVHPAVRPRIVEAIADAERRAAPAVVIEAIKLVEGGLAELCDEVWLVTCAPSAQLRRLAGRGMDEDDARRRIDAQGDLAERLRAGATLVIDTSGPIADVRAGVGAAFEAVVTAGRRRRKGHPVPPVGPGGPGRRARVSGR